MATIAAFIAGAIWSEVRTCRFWFGSKNRANGAPELSVTRVVTGSGASATSVETVVTLSPASLETIPKPTAAGNVIPATRTPARTHKPANRAIGRTKRAEDPTTGERTSVRSQLSN